MKVIEGQIHRGGALTPDRATWVIRDTPGRYEQLFRSKAEFEEFCDRLLDENKTVEATR